MEFLCPPQTAGDRTLSISIGWTSAKRGNNKNKRSRIYFNYNNLPSLTHQTLAPGTFCSTCWSRRIRRIHQPIFECLWGDFEPPLHLTRFPDHHLSWPMRLFAPHDVTMIHIKWNDTKAEMKIQNGLFLRPTSSSMLSTKCVWIPLIRHYLRLSVEGGAYVVCIFYSDLLSKKGLHTSYTLTQTHSWKGSGFLSCTINEGGVLVRLT